MVTPSPTRPRAMSAQDVPCSCCCTSLARLANTYRRGESGMGVVVAPLRGCYISGWRNKQPRVAYFPLFPGRNDRNGRIRKGAVGPADRLPKTRARTELSVAGLSFFPVTGRDFGKIVCFSV